MRKPKISQRWQVTTGKRLVQYMPYIDYSRSNDLLYPVRTLKQLIDFAKIAY